MRVFEYLAYLFFTSVFFQRSATDVSNFDREFTDEQPVLTPPHENNQPLSRQEQHLFSGFDFYADLD